MRGRLDDRGIDPGAGDLGGGVVTSRRSAMLARYCSIGGLSQQDEVDVVNASEGLPRFKS